MFEVCIDVDSAERAIDFYRRVLGLELIESDRGWARMADGETTFWVMESPAGSSASSESHIPREYRRHWTPIHLDFVVPDLDEAIGRAVAAGGKLEGKIQERPGISRLATVVDPFGHGFDLVQRLKKS
jgi:predicted enzyme related to lactoylglutathione lyase